jgi:hypothetical protein
MGARSPLTKQEKGGATGLAPGVPGNILNWIV